MKRCLMLLALVLVASNAHAQNVLINGSFELPSTPGANPGTSVPAGWTPQFGAETYVSLDPGGNAVDGSYYLQIGVYTALAQITPLVVTPGTSYNLAAFGRSFGVGPYDVRVYAGTAVVGDITSGVEVGRVQFPGDDSVQTMTEMTTTFTPAASEVGKTLGVYIAAHAFYYGFDNVRLSVIPEPSTIALASVSALGGLMTLRRRLRTSSIVS